MKEGTIVQAVRACFAGGVTRQVDRNVEHEVALAYVIQASERKGEAVEKMEWRTMGGVAKVLPDDVTMTHAETIVAGEAVRVIGCLRQDGQFTFDVDGDLIEEWDENAKRTKFRMKENTEERRTRAFDDEIFLYRHFDTRILHTFLHSFQLRPQPKS